jgi:hypothetical protein
MTEETNRSLQRLEDLHSEMGTERINAWITEHIFEIGASLPSPAAHHDDDTFVHATSNGHHSDNSQQD